VSVSTITSRINFIESVFGKGNLARNYRNIEVRCPFCLPTNENKKKLAIKIDDFKNHCWVCGFRSRSLFPLLIKHSTKEKLEEYKKLFMTDREKTYFGNEQVVKVDKIELPRDFKLLAISTKDPDVIRMQRYLIVERGLSRNDLWFYKLGYSDELKWKNRVIVPSFSSSGDLNYFIGRTILKTHRPTYENPDYNKNEIVFNEINVDWTKRLVLCEGVFDMFKCGSNVVPLLGSDLNEESMLFNMILCHNTPIALSLDSDMRLTKTVKLVKKLSEYNIDVIIVNMKDHKDPGSMTKAQFQQALQDAKPFNWTENYHEKLLQLSNMKLKLF